MAINLITGQPRNGKSQRMIAQVIDVFIKENDKREKQGKPRRPIYIDIDGVNAPDTVTQLPDCITEFEQDKIWFGEHDDPLCPPDYWKPPYGSIFVFDECHKRYWVKDTSGSISKEPATVSLNEHGHAGHDIWLLTQFPQYIHTHIRGLVQEHWHVKRVLNLAKAKVYKWNEFYLSPRTESAFANAYEVENFKFKKKYENAYKSASAHAPIKFTFPKKLVLPLGTLFVLAILFLYFGKDSMFIKEYQKKADEKQQQTDQKIDDLQKQNQGQQQQMEQMQLQLNELKEKYLPKHITALAEHEDVRPAMVISSPNGGCTAFNKYGEPLALPDDLCLMMDKYPSMIPRSRSVSTTSQPTTINNDNLGSVNPFNQQTAQNTQQPAIKGFDHTKDF